MTELTREQMHEIRTREVFDPRNVQDRYKGMSHEQIQTELDLLGGNLVACAMNTIRDFNFSTLIRNANAFGVRDVVLCGHRRWDRRGAVGAHNYLRMHYESDIRTAMDSWRDKGYRLVAAEYDDRYESTSVYDYAWKNNTLLIFGEEGVTLPDEVLDYVDDIVHIPMVGSVRSVNVGCASAVMMSHYLSQHTPPVTG